MQHNILNLNDDLSTFSRGRLILITLLSLGLMVLCLGRLFQVMILQHKNLNDFSHKSFFRYQKRADIVDTKGNLLASQIATASVYAVPESILDAKETAKKLSTIFKNVKEKALYKKLTSDKKFFWVKRHITPIEQEKINEVGLPGIHLQKDQRRIYPHGSLMSHIIGFCDVDGKGRFGLEQSFEKRLTEQADTPLTLSIDLKIQNSVRSILQGYINEFKAIGGSVILMKQSSGQIVSMISLPDFTPNKIEQKDVPNLFNRNIMGVYEHGSVYKILNSALSLEAGHTKPLKLYDPRDDIFIGRYKIKDHKKIYRKINFAEHFVLSSNRVSIQLVRETTKDVQKNFFNNIGFLEKIGLELPEKAAPIYLKEWPQYMSESMSYGYAIAVTPLHLVTAVNGILNNGIMVYPTLFKGKKPTMKKITSPQTSKIVRYLMGMAVNNGTVRKAQAPGYYVMGKTGTAFQANDKKRRLTSCIVSFGGYTMQVMLDKPQGIPRTHNLSSAGWNAAELAGTLVKRLAPLLKILPDADMYAKKKPYWVTETLRRLKDSPPYEKPKH